MQYVHASLSYFEDVFAFFTRIAAPGVAALSAEDDDTARKLWEGLDAYHLANTASTSHSMPPALQRPDKAAMVWRCYDEAVLKRVLTNQGEQPNSFNSPAEAGIGLMRFIVGVVGIAALLGVLFKVKWDPFWRWCATVAGKANSWLRLKGVWDQFYGLYWIRATVKMTRTFFPGRYGVSGP